MTTRIAKIRWDGKWFESPAGVLYRSGFAGMRGFSLTIRHYDEHYTYAVNSQRGSEGMGTCPTQQAAQRTAMRIARKAASEMAMPGG